MKTEHKILLGVGIGVGLILLSAKKTAPGKNTGGTNNPGNLRASAEKFLGETTKEGQTFKTFQDLQHGIRAMYVILRTYKSKYNLATIRGVIDGIVTRYAPPSENDTDNYIAYVAKRVGLNPDAPIPVSMYPAIVVAMSEMEGRAKVTLAEAQQTYNKFFA